MADEEEWWTGDIFGGVALVFSNLALLPAIFLLAKRGDTTSGTVLLLTFIASVLYHSCRAGFFCVMQAEMHVITDYLFVYIGIVWIITSLPFFILKSANEAQWHTLLFFVLVAPVFFCILAQVSQSLLPIIGIGYPFVFIYIVVAMAPKSAETSKRRRIFSRGSGWVVCLALLSFILAGIFMFLMPESFYPTAHSLWHVFSMIGAFLLVVARPY